MVKSVYAYIDSGVSIASRLRSKGAAILMALIIVAIAATMAATMMARQQASLVAEEARRHSTQARWILRGLLDLGQFLMRSTAARERYDPLFTFQTIKPTSIKSFLSATDNADDAVFEAFFEIKFEDAQAKFNLRNLVDSNGQTSPTDMEAFEKLLTNLGIRDAKALTVDAGANVSSLVLLQLFEPRAALDLITGLDSEQRTMLDKYVTLLPVSQTKVNVNTASAEVISAIVPGLALPVAQTIVLRRTFFTEPGQFINQIPGARPKGAAPIDVAVFTQYVNVTGIVTWDTLTIEQRALVNVVRSNGGGPPVTSVVKVAYGPTMPEKAPAK
jgi:general secretion pathway protein K